MMGGAGRNRMLAAANSIFEARAEHLSGRSAAWLLAAAFAALVASRLYLLFSTDFPINDGGLFLEFIRSTVDVFPHIPDTVSYNGHTLPFAYPPLSFWVGALLTKMGFDALGVVRVLPILMNGAYALLFGFLLLRSGQPRFTTAVTLIFFLASARSYEWLAMGGGISRGFGSIFLLLSLIAVGLPGTERRPPLQTLRLVVTGALVGGAILSHLEWGLLAATSVTVSLGLGCRTFRDFVRSSFIAGMTAFVLIAPWVASVFANHGVEPFLAAGQTSQSGLFHSLEQLLWLARSNIFNLFLVLGGLALLWQRRFFWIVFFFLCVFVTPRHGPTPVVLPLAVFAGEGVVAAYRLFCLLTKRRLVAASAAGVLAAAVLALQVAQESEERLLVVRPLSPEQREAMAWVARNHRDAVFAVLTPLAWQADRSAEWFTVLARATSTTTVQGREWLPNGDFKDREDKVLALKDSKSCPELLRNLAALEPAQFVWVETGAQCFRPRAYEPVFQNTDVVIFRNNAVARTGKHG